MVQIVEGLSEWFGWKLKEKPRYTLGYKIYPFELLKSAVYFKSKE